jgi:hypothetical protein
MGTWTLEALSAGKLSGVKSHQTCRLCIKASFGDMLKLQSPNKE